MNKINVAFVINDFSGAGAQKLVADILVGMDRARFQPTLVTLFALGGAAGMYHLVPPDVPVTRLSFKNVWDVRSWRALYKIFKRERVDVVVSHLFFSNTVCRILKLCVGYRVITTEHNTYTNKSHLHQLVDRILAIVTYAIIAVSSTVKKFTARQEGIPLSKFRVILNGAEIATLGRAARSLDAQEIKQELGLQDARIMINVARLNEQKNHSLLLKGFASFAAIDERFHLLILGEGEKRMALIEEARKLGIEERVHFLGYRDDVYRYYAASDFFVSTSTIEGLSIAYIEALAAGLPILATKTSGTDEMIEEGQNGFFIGEHNPSAVTEGLMKMASADLASMREGAKHSAQRFDIKTTVKNYEALILEALSS
ncbi:glycosyltransferase [Candidatus Wolfebacteria bacterium]|nr:glycosyltransferase [Candidatus Wolfebacteria bacterium]